MTIRSFVRRSGRTTQGQKRALSQLWDRYVLQPDAKMTAAAIFGDDKPLHLEIGFGMGDALLEMARAHPENNYIGIEVYQPGVGHLLSLLEKYEVKNVRVSTADAMQVLSMHTPLSALDAVYVYFPDPWPKKRHQKRRMIQTPFLNVLAKALRPDGVLNLATDWEHYARQMLTLLEAHPDFDNLAGSGFSSRIPQRPLTKFEQRGIKLGHGVWDLRYQRR